MMVGTGRFELPTCRLGGGRSIHLSYVPTAIQDTGASRKGIQAAASVILLACAVTGLQAQLPPSDFAAQKPPVQVKQISLKNEHDVRVKDIQFTSVTGTSISAYQVEPREGCSPRHPCAGAVFVHWYEPHARNSNRSEFLPDAYDLARHGAVSLLVQTMWSDPEWFQKRNPDEDYPKSIEEVKNLRRAVDVLMRQPGIDATRIAYIGHDFGMMYGAILAGIDHRIRVLVLMAGTTCLSDWFLLGRNLPPGDQNRIKRELSPLCPILYVPRATGPVLLQFGNKDPYVPIKSAQAMAEAAPEPKRVRFYDTGHELDGAARVDRLQWLALRLRLRPAHEQ
jgi:pimeloyl-ACP methyl ester carboxylesterase